jgi:hypothetical protein
MTMLTDGKSTENLRVFLFFLIAAFCFSFLAYIAIDYDVVFSTAHTDKIGRSNLPESRPHINLWTPGSAIQESATNESTH